MEKACLALMFAGQPVQSAVTMLQTDLLSILETTGGAGAVKALYWTSIGYR